MRRCRLALLLAGLGGGCASEETGGAQPLPYDCLPPNRLVVDRCLEPGVQADGCPAGTLGLDDGSCQPAGVPPELCGEGFEPDGKMGCEPILPSAPCPPGEMAVPGESACHAVMPCAAGKWGDIPVDATTVYVDASYPGLDSDGSSARPFTRISDAVVNAATDSLIAIAAGSYLEDVAIAGKTVRLWGKCPGEVELLGTSSGWAALDIYDGASGTTVHGLALSGASRGLSISGAEGVLVERVWAHDAFGRGVSVDSVLGPTSVTLRGSLIEQNQDLGVNVAGATATLEGVLVRGTSSQLFGWGINIQPLCTADGCGPGSTSFVRNSLVEQNHDAGVRVAGSEATLEGVVVRNTLPRESDLRGGRGIVVQLACPPSGCDPAMRSTALVRGSLIEENRDLGVVVGGSEATLEGVVVRNTWPRESDRLYGRGLSINPSCGDTGCAAARSNALVRASLFEQNHDVGVYVAGSEATLEGLLIRGTLPATINQLSGRGLSIQLACPDHVCDPTALSTALVRGSLVEQNHDVGVYVRASDATLEGLLVRGTFARQADGLFGDGLNVASQSAPANATVASSRIEGSARAGISNFGAAVALGTSALACNAFDLEGEIYLDQPFTFENLGHNACGCPDPLGVCKTQSVGLDPPEPLGDSWQ